MSKIYEQHPVYGGPLVRNKQEYRDLQESFPVEDDKLFLPRFRNLNHSRTIVLAYIDIEGGYLLASRPNKQKYPRKLKTQETDTACARRGGPLVTGLNPLGPFKKDTEDFLQIGGPITLNINSKKYYHYLYAISEFSEILKPNAIEGVEDFFWISAGIIPEVFKNNDFFQNETFSVFQDYLNGVFEIL